MQQRGEHLSLQTHQRVLPLQTRQTAHRRLKSRQSALLRQIQETFVQRKSHPPQMLHLAPFLLLEIELVSL
jgi:hypothetical protein